MVALYNGFEEGTSGTTLTSGSGGNTAGSGVNFLDVVSVGTGTTLAFSNTQAMHGSLSMAVATDGTSAAAFAGWSTSLGTVTNHFGRVYVFMSAAPGSSDAFIQFQSGSGTFAGGIQLQTGKILEIQNAASTFIQAFTTVMSLSTWYRIEWQLVSSSTTGTMQVNLYLGDSATLLEGHTTAGGNYGPSCDQVNIGWTGNHTSQPTVYVDDFGLSTTGFLGPYVPPITPVTVLQAKLPFSSMPALTPQIIGTSIGTFALYDADTGTVTDALLSTSATVLADAGGVSDALKITQATALSDGGTVTDAQLSLTPVALADAGGTVDAWLSTSATTLADSGTLTDSPLGVGGTLNPQLADGGSETDILYGFPIQLADGGTMTDQATGFLSPPIFLSGTGQQLTLPQEELADPSARWFTPVAGVGLTASSYPYLAPVLMPITAYICTGGNPVDDTVILDTYVPKGIVYVIQPPPFRKVVVSIIPVHTAIRTTWLVPPTPLHWEPPARPQVSNYTGKIHASVK